MRTKVKWTLASYLHILLVLVLLQPIVILIVTLHQKSRDASVKTVGETIRVRKSYTREYLSETVVRNNRSLIMPRWQMKGLNSRLAPLSKRQFFLTEVLHVRIYKGDKANWTIKELKQWMHYMYYSGVEHIFICDHAQKPSEKIDKELRGYIKLEFATYIHWPTPKHVVLSKLDCYRYWMRHLKDRNEWQVSVDMDEYPFVVADQSEGFLARYLRTVNSEVVQILMENYLMLGEGDRNCSMTIERITRRTRQRANKLTKPLYRVEHTRPGMHRFFEKRNNRRAIRTIYGEADKILMLHYWGTRLQLLGDGLPHMIGITKCFDTVKIKIAPQIRNSLLAFGESEAFSTASGP